MNKTFYERVASLTGQDAKNLEQLALGELIQEIILPKLCFKNPQCISEDFVNFMAEFGHEIYEQNKYHGEALYDLSLQHLFLDGCLFALPEVYKKPCMQMDFHYGLQPIGKAEFHFLKEQRAILLSLKEYSNLLFCHAEKIIFEILENITPEGELLKKGLCKDGVAPKELRAFAEETAGVFLGFQRVYAQLSTPTKWKIWPQFFLDHQREFSWSDFAERIGFHAAFRPGKKCREMVQNYNKKGSV